MSEINNVHDKFFKQVMGNKKTAKSMLKNYLPTKILKLIDLEEMELEKDSMIEKELEETFSDLLYKVKIDGKEAYLYFLFEHKSYPYQNIALQLLKYMRKIWDLKLEQGKEDKLPLIIPMVFYHGRESWNIGLKLSDLLEEIPSELEEYIPDFKYLLYDFSAYGNQEVKGIIELRIFLELLRYIFTDVEQFKEKLEEILTLFEQLEEKETAMDYFETMIRYIMNAKEGMSEQDLVQVAEKISSEKGEDIMTIAEKLRNEGKEEGKKEMVKNMLKEGVSLQKIMKASKLSKEEIKELQKEIQH